MNDTPQNGPIDRVTATRQLSAASKTVGIPLLDHEALLASPRLYVEIPVPREVAPRAAAPGPPLRKSPR